MKLLFIIILFPIMGYSAATRTIDADTIRSSDATKSYTVPFNGLPIGASFVQEVPSGTVDSSNQTFTITYTPVSVASVMLFMDGMILLQGGGNDYTISGNTITMVTAPRYGQSLQVVYSRY